MKQIFFKKAMFSKVIASVMFLLMTNFVNAQTSADWKLQSEKNGVKLFYKVENCSGKNSLLLKFENTTTAAKHVGCHIIVESKGHNMPILPMFIELKPNETKAGACNDKTVLVTDIKNITDPKLRVILNAN